PCHPPSRHCAPAAPPSRCPRTPPAAGIPCVAMFTDEAPPAPPTRRRLNRALDAAARATAAALVDGGYGGGESSGDEGGGSGSGSESGGEEGGGYESDDSSDESVMLGVPRRGLVTVVPMLIRALRVGDAPAVAAAARALHALADRRPCKFARHAARAPAVLSSFARALALAPAAAGDALPALATIERADQLDWGVLSLLHAPGGAAGAAALAGGLVRAARDPRLWGCAFDMLSTLTLMPAPPELAARVIEAGGVQGMVDLLRSAAAPAGAAPVDGLDLRECAARVLLRVSESGAAGAATAAGAEGALRALAAAAAPPQSCPHAARALAVIADAGPDLAERVADTPGALRTLAAHATSRPQDKGGHVNFRYKQSYFMGYNT
ncbi:MAG: hypothetical protein J3K34DRAFT_507317, partial [Monoraphidium minutum]